VKVKLSGHFLDGVRGPVFVLAREPAAPARGCVLVVPPFAEEMNKCRAMMTDVAVALAQRGIGTVLPDLYGTGDSGGDFSDGDLAVWREDLLLAMQWCRQRLHAVTGILAVRLGCALAAALVSSGRTEAMSRTVLWQPVFDGGRHLTQFLRLRITAALAEQDRKETLAELRARLQAGEIVEVAGYPLSGQLTEQLAALSVPTSLPPQLGKTAWLEIVRDGAALPQPAAQLIERSRAAGIDVELRTFPGEPFWAATDIVRNRALTGATIDAFAASLATSASRAEVGAGR
jgi:exosortase A-associated hydrolase 2